ncbi:MlaE family lipid ABC transporter permease subunit [uncultured Paracoccus sp.]|uniref:ABC transporter permease n=1 Tax=uncultured Paracoccus sp. TaxID=189685 RepID=UPI00261C7F07|nr:MlaE family lipid ABC transporter permease subunit [uncultured Paracoccus sp.]
MTASDLASGATPVRIAVTDERISIAGDLSVEAVSRIDRTALLRDGRGAAVLDITQVHRLDASGAWLLVELERRLSTAQRQVDLLGYSDAQGQLLETVRRNLPTEAPKKKPEPGLTDRLEALGRGTAGAVQVAIALTGFLGQVIAALVAALLRPSRLRLTSVVHHMQEVGWKAIPIVALMAFLIGVVLAFQGAAQLRQFGAEVFVVDLIAISVLRELGILLTAIIVAGRSGSAFTAAIGSMKMREEIDAMRTLGLDPVVVLVVPRVLALILMLPVLGFIADISGLIGGAIMSWIELGVSPAVFRTRLVANTDGWHFGVGMIKAPFFALIIGIIGCYEGMMVEGHAESLGRLTSLSVVLSIFMVIVADAMFSIFFAVVGV